MYRGQKIIVLIMAAGIGNRFGAGIPKQYVTVGDEPMVILTCKAFADNDYVDDIFLVCAEDKIEYCAELFTDANGKLGEGFEKIKGFIPGGDTRQESVFNGLNNLNLNYYPAIWEDKKVVSNSTVLIHDAARPYVKDELIERVIKTAYFTGSAIPCVPVNDTLYRVDNLDEMLMDVEANLGMRAKDADTEQVPDYNVGCYIREVVNRDEYVSVQTPQAFVMNVIYDAHQAAAEEKFFATDDGSLLYRRGRSVFVVEGDSSNIKITTQSDLSIDKTDQGDETCASLPPGELLKPNFDTGDALRIGSGFDVHAFANDRKLILGGVEIPYEKGLLGHSDADVLTHALMDAMLGALSLGDIGSHFPDTDEKYKGISSIELLVKVKELVSEKGWEIVNADLTIIAEKPKMRPHISGIIKALSDVLDIPSECIGLKATTTEGLGFTGREEGIGSQAIVLLKKI